MLAEAQVSLEAHRSDAARLRDDLATAQREVSRLSASLAKASAQIEFQDGK